MGFFCYWVVKVLYMLCILSAYQLYGLQIYFFHFVGFLFTLLFISLAVQKLFSLMQSHLSIFVFVACAFGVICKKSLPRTMSWGFAPMFLSRNFTVSGFVSKYSSLSLFFLTYKSVSLNNACYGLNVCVPLKIYMLKS